MKIVFFKISCVLLLLFAESYLPVLAQTPTPTPSLNIPAIPRIQTEIPIIKNSIFLNVLAKRLATRNLTIDNFCPQDNIVTRRILKDYGAVFVGSGDYASPCYFRDENVVLEVQNKLGISRQVIDGVAIELQPAAMQALLKAVAEAKKQGLNITPRGGSIAARRTFSNTVTLWNSRVYAGLTHWVNQGRITALQAQSIRQMQVFEQVAAILQLEEKGIYFSKDLSKSILYSVAAPGTSQHNLMLALDVVQFANPRVRQILADNGWFQTVASDLPHFTYLGVPSGELRSLGLRDVTIGNQVFWIPQMEASQ